MTSSARLPVILLLAALPVFAAGCSVLESNAGVEQVYHLRPAAPSAPAATVPVTLQLLRPEVEPGLQGTRIALVRDGNRLDYYAKARWAGTLTEVVQSLAAQTLRASGAFAAVDTDRGGFGAQAALAITVRRFEAAYGGDEKAAPVAHVHLECTLGDRLERRTLATFDVDLAVPARDNRLGAVVAALEQAANQALAQVVQRSAAELARQNPGR